MALALVEAAAAGDLEEVRRLLEQGIPVDTRGRQGSTPLISAALGGHADVVELLLERGADPNSRTTTGHNALVMAASFGYREIFNRLVAAGARVGMVEAATLGDLDALSRLLAEGIHVDDRNRHGTMALIEAAHHGHLEAVRFLLDFGAEINARTDYAGWTALMMAIHSGYGDVARHLLERGADVTARDDEGKTALHLAVRFHWALNSRDLALDILDQMESVRKEMHSLIRMLVSHGAEVNAADAKGMTPLRWAECTEDREMAQLLRDLGAT